MAPQVDVVVGGTRRKVKVRACIDTGFDGDVCIPIETALDLGLELIGAENVELADGSCNRELVFRGYALFLGRRRTVHILLTRSTDSLVGTGLLSGYRLSIDFAVGAVRLTRKARRSTDDHTN